jgi:hypothetical protein
MREDGSEATNAAGDDHLGSHTAAQTIEQFIGQVIEAATRREDFDATLLKIVTIYIIKERPAEDAVARVAAQIEALAERRALLAEKKVLNGIDNA